MPGKVNPVIPEVVNQIAFEVIGNDITVTMAAEAGQLQLNAFEPIIAHSLFKSLQHLGAGCRTLAERCVNGITANRRARAAPARRIHRAGHRAQPVPRLRALQRDRAGGARHRRARLRPGAAEEADDARAARRDPAARSRSPSRITPPSTNPSANHETPGFDLPAGGRAGVSQGYPSKPVRIIVNFPAGGVADLYARIIGAKVQEVLGPAGGGREPHRRRRQYRRRSRGEVRPRRLHAQHERDRPARGQREPVLQDAVRPGEGLRRRSRWCSRPRACWWFIPRCRRPTSPS